METYTSVITEFEKIWEQSEKVRSSPEYRIYKDLMAIRNSFKINQINHSLLKEEISKYYAKGDLHEMSKYERSRLQHKITAHLYNYIASCRTFLEHHFSKNEFLDEEIHCFIKELRNYIIHNEMIILAIGSKYMPKGPYDQTESFDTSSFKDYLNDKIQGAKQEKTKHKRYALKFLEANEDRGFLPLSKIVEEYSTIISSLYRRRILEVAQKEESSLKGLTAEVEKILDELKRIKMSAGFVPLNRVKIRYLNYLFYFARKEG